MDRQQDRLELDSRLEDLSRVPGWVEAIASRLDLNEQTHYAIDLCLEEALANVVLHGYANQPGHPIILEALWSDASIAITIEDQAQPFAPTEPPTSGVQGPAANLESIKPGGNGLRLIHHFAADVKYETFPFGNRLTLSFPIGSTIGTQ